MYRFDKEKYEKRMAWYTHDRFGMFIHFGLYAIPGRGEWVRSYERIPQEDYQPYFEQFNPENFDARDWARRAKAAGMKYVVLTAKHHDGFCLFDTAYTDYKVTNTPFKRDIVREFTDAVRAEGLKVGLYYSLLDWVHLDYPHQTDRYHPMRENPAYPDEGRNWQTYVDYYQNQVRELCTNYGKIDILWFDFSYNEMRGPKWQAEKLIEMVRGYQPEVIIDNRLEVSGEGFGSLAEGRPTPYHGDFVTPEKMIPPQGLKDVNGRDLVWESCITMNNNWGYFREDHLFKPADLLIKKLVECVSKGGNMILNVGPDETGAFPPESCQILDTMGAWMQKNGESIYGCGKADLPKPDCGRFTRNKNNVYLHIYENSLGPLPVPQIAKDRVESACLLADGRPVPVSTSWVHSDYPQVCFFDLGEDPVLPDLTDTVLKITLKEEK